MWEGQRLLGVGRANAALPRALPGGQRRQRTSTTRRKQMPSLKLHTRPAHPFTPTMDRSGWTPAAFRQQAGRPPLQRLPQQQGRNKAARAKRKRRAGRPAGRPAGALPWARGGPSIRPGPRTREEGEGAAPPTAGPRPAAPMITCSQGFTQLACLLSLPSIDTCPPLPPVPPLLLLLLLIVINHHYQPWESRRWFLLLLPRRLHSDQCGPAARRPLSVTSRCSRPRGVAVPQRAAGRPTR